MDNENLKFTQGFNAGYILHFYESAMLHSLISSTISGSEYIKGLIEGKNQRQFEIDQKDISNLRSKRDFEREL